MGQKHSLESIVIMDVHARMNDNVPGKYRGLKRDECRGRVIDDLKEQGLLLKVEQHAHAVGQCYRCNTVIEPYLSDQWFVKMKPLAAEALKVVRDGKTLIVEVTPREKGKVEGEELDCPRWDFTVKVINQFDNPDLYFYRKKGVFIYGIKYPGNASNSNLEVQDIILKIDGKEIETLEDIKKIHAEAIKNIETEHRVLVTVMRSGLTRQIVLDFLRDYERE